MTRLHSRSPIEVKNAPASLHLFMCAYMRRSVADMTAMLQDLELSMPQMGTLHFLNAEGTQSVSAIARHLGLSLAATSHLIDRLVQRGLLTRSEDPSDRRHKRVALAPEGVTLIAQVNERAIASLEAMLENVPKDVRETFQRSLEKVVEALGVEAG
jgi:DNA-binding MarR family transcriptional regulator